MMKWGRTDEEWTDLCSTAEQFLADQARMERTTTYTELNTVLVQRTGHAAFNFNLDRDRAAMGGLLEEIAVANLPVVGALVSAVVIYLNENDAGTGFYELAKQQGLLSKRPTRDEREVFWTSQVAKVHEHYGARSN